MCQHGAACCLPLTQVPFVELPKHVGCLVFLPVANFEINKIPIWTIGSHVYLPNHASITPPLLESWLMEQGWCIWRSMWPPLCDGAQAWLGNHKVWKLWRGGGMPWHIKMTLSILNPMHQCIYTYPAMLPQHLFILLKPWLMEWGCWLWRSRRLTLCEGKLKHCYIEGMPWQASRGIFSDIGQHWILT